MRKSNGRPAWWVLLVSLAVVVAAACGGGAPLAAPAPQPRPQPPTQPAPAAPAPEPQAAPAPALPRVSPPPAVKPAAASQGPWAGKLRLGVPTGSDRLVGEIGLPQPQTVMVGAEDEPKRGGVATFGVRRDPPAGWDRMKTTLGHDLHQMGAPLWGGGNLVRYCPEDAYRVCPALAESWEVNPDFTQYTFKVRVGAVWHDGTPFTPEDVKFWLDLWFFGAKGGDKVRKPSLFAPQVGDAKKVELLPDKRVRVTLGTRNPMFLDLLMHPSYAIAHPRHLAQPRIERGEVDITPLDLGLVGTGPFQLVKYDKGSRGQVRRFDHYWEKDPLERRLPYLDGLEFAILSDPAAMDAAFRVGRLDGGSPGAGFVLSRERHAAYLRDMGEKVWFAKMASGTGATGQQLGFNLLKPGPWQDPRVRRAILLWVEKRDSHGPIHGGFGYIGGILNPGNPFSNPDLLAWPGWNQATREKDRAEAKRLMAEAGYGRGFTLNMPCLTTTTWRDSCVFWQAQLAGLNITLKFDLMDAPQWTLAGQSLDYDVAQVGGAIPPPFPEAFEHSMNVYSRNKSAWAKHEDPKVPAAFDRLRNAATLEQRAQVWRELERYWLLEQVYSVTLGGHLSIIPYRSHVKGRIVPPEHLQGYFDFATLWLDK